MPDKLTTLIGSVERIVTKPDGATETVRIRQLPIRLLPQYLASLDDEPRMVELLCDKPSGWSDSLSPADFEGIIEEGERLNSDFFSRWLERKKKREQFLPKPDLDQIEKVLDVLTRNNPELVPQLLQKAGLNSPTGSSKSPSPAA